jgi:hypothetical protein
LIANNGNVDHDDKNNVYDDDGEFISKAYNMSIMLNVHIHAYSKLSQKSQLEREQVLAPSLQVSMGESVETLINQVVILQEIVNY